ncbi:uncharacterized protein K02A2.6-like [Gigantopelta aegis]|uniref:uncharacterized protein K02A2.6-like n=1 Tax=Gigantopelta aegis TaxID=1735272 RepID=UPI001B889D68|nr:uncharacterized protein K02A2.6-like [Gigantopelta aegis]
MEVHIVPSISAASTIAKLRDIFATFGLPEQIVSDNGTGFTSVEFQQFLAANGIKQVLTSPYHPSSNGLAERVVQTFKNAVTKQQQDSLQLNFDGRRLRTHLDLLHPDTAVRMNDKQEKSIPGRALR